MPYWVLRWRFSDLNFLPSSRQIRKSAVIDFLIETAGTSFSSAAGAASWPSPVKAKWVLAISAGRSDVGTLLCETKAETIPATSSTSRSLLSDIAVPMHVEAHARGLLHSPERASLFCRIRPPLLEAEERWVVRPPLWSSSSKLRSTPRFL